MKDGRYIPTMAKINDDFEVNVVNGTIEIRCATKPPSGPTPWSTMREPQNPDGITVLDLYKYLKHEWKNDV